uniref:C-type lectin domain-containing protein n=1 Tax=Salarias fasciatus TaxID=181472 RepID=A0A672HX51_SALFA
MNFFKIIISTADRHTCHEQLRDSLKLYRCVAVSFGLLCILQVALNISLRLPLSESYLFTSHRSHNGWLYFSHSFYYISQIKKTWPDSRNDCLQRGADLVIINSREEQVLLVQNLMWIGLSKRDGIWEWVDGTRLAQSFWCSGEPNNHKRGNEDCVQIHSCHPDHGWNDEECRHSSLWICEKNMAL